MKTTACVLLLAAAAWGQQVAVPQGGTLGPSSKLSDAATLNADKVDGSHTSATPGANTVPVADGSGKIAPGWIPPHGHAESEISDLVTHLEQKAPLDNPVFTGVVNAVDITAAGSLQVGVATPQVSFAYGSEAPTGACTAGMYWQKAAANSVAEYMCVNGSWVASGTGGGLGGSVTAGKILLAASASAAGDSAMTENAGDITSTKGLIAPSYATSGTSPFKAEGLKTTPSVASADDKCKMEFNSATSRPSFVCGTGGTPKDIPIAGDAPAAHTHSESDLVLADNGTANVSSTKHGLAPKLPNDATKYLNGLGQYSVPSGSETSPSLTEDTNNVNSGKPVVIAGAQSKIDQISEGTAAVAASGKGALSFSSSDHHPYYSYNAGAAKKVLLEGDAAGGSATALYNTPLVAVTRGQAATTLYTVGGSNEVLVFRYGMVQNGSANCSQQPHYNVRVIFTDPVNNTAVIWQLGVSRADGTEANYFGTGNTISNTQYVAGGPIRFIAKTGTAVQMDVVETNSPSCTSWPAYNVYPVLQAD